MIKKREKSIIAELTILLEKVLREGWDKAVVKETLIETVGFFNQNQRESNDNYKLLLLLHNWLEWVLKNVLNRYTKFMTPDEYKEFENSFINPLLGYFLSKETIDNLNGDSSSIIEVLCWNHSTQNLFNKDKAIVELNELIEYNGGDHEAVFTIITDKLIPAMINQLLLNNSGLLLLELVENEDNNDYHLKRFIKHLSNSINKPDNLKKDLFSVINGFDNDYNRTTTIPRLISTELSSYEKETLRNCYPMTTPLHTIKNYYEFCVTIEYLLGIPFVTEEFLFDYDEEHFAKTISIIKRALADLTKTNKEHKVIESEKLYDLLYRTANAKPNWSIHLKRGV